ncbi:MAG TPA: hypothetical protein VLI71_02890, partial [Gammaproteobacteria bacterium]|nr:hypothetical protein [Gammaproteobacteria bacterium]
PPVASVAIDIDDNHQVGSVYWPNGNTSSGGAGAPVQGLACGAMDLTFHAHFHVAFFLNGDQLAVPNGIGSVEPRPGSHCYYAIHTHEMSGKVHLEAAAPGVFTLGQMFRIWGQPLEWTNVAGFTGLPVVVYIVDANATTATKYEGDLKLIELVSKRGIVFQIGEPIREIPRYTWWGP